MGMPILDAIMPFVRASRHESSWLLMAPLVAAGHMQLGDLESAERLLDDALGAANRSGARFVTGTTERLLAEIDLTRDPDDHEGKAAETVRAERSQRSRRSAPRTSWAWPSPATEGSRRIAATTTARPIG